MSEEKTDATIYKMTMYITDFSNAYPELKDLLYYLLSNVDASVKIAKVDSVPILWHDDIDINKTDAPIGDYEKYFKK